MGVLLERQSSEEGRRDSTCDQSVGRKGLRLKDGLQALCPPLGAPRAPEPTPEPSPGSPLLGRPCVPQALGTQHLQSRVSTSPPSQSVGSCTGLSCRGWGHRPGLDGSTRKALGLGQNQGGGGRELTTLFSGFS